MNSPLLRRLRDLPTFEMATGDPDPRGWTVRGSDGQPLGTVYELLVDPMGQRVLYLDVVLAAGLPGLLPPAPHTDQRILLPLAAVNLDMEGSSVFVTSLNHANISTYPLFVDFILPADFEESMREKLGLQ
jgi:photosynthetic reaction center H subunit